MGQLCRHRMLVMILLGLVSGLAVAFEGPTRGPYATALPSQTPVLSQSKQAASSVTSAGIEAFSEFRDCADCPEMIQIPGGSFRMGDLSGKGLPLERPVQSVRVASFSVGKYEVTFKEWDACVRAGGCQTIPSDSGWGRNRRPVISVNWEDTQQYVKWLSGRTGKQYRLPSEAEWEYAARAGTKTEFSFGNCVNTSLANYNGAGENFKGCGKTGVDLKKTQPVGSYRPNPWGLYDVHGNVWEWVEDCWKGDHAGRDLDGSAFQPWKPGECTHRVFRGGAWFGFPLGVRSASRYRSNARFDYWDVGFRLARTD